MNAMFPKLFERGKIGRLEIKNRVVKAPTYGALSNIDGSVTDRMIRYYEEVARGGTGLVIVESASIDNKASKAAPCELGISSIEHIPGLAALAQGICDQGTGRHYNSRISAETTSWVLRPQSLLHGSRCRWAGWVRLRRSRTNRCRKSLPLKRSRTS